MKLKNYNFNQLSFSNITVLISISLVLFLIGIFAILFINVQNYSDYIKEKVVIEIFFKPISDSTNFKIEEQNHINILKTIKNLPSVLDAKYIDKKTAFKIAVQELNVDTSFLFKKDIFPPSIRITLRSKFVNPNNIKIIKEYLLRFKNVEEIKNDDQLVHTLYNSINKIFIWIFCFAILFTIISIILINNSIRLKIYSKRFIIKTMQLVGAKRRFILYPFLKEAFFIGFFGSIISLSILFSIYIYLMKYFNQSINWIQIYYITIIIFLIGIIITFGSTFFIIWKFLNIRKDKLY